jgi:hypothetical protein
MEKRGEQWREKRVSKRAEKYTSIDKTDAQQEHNWRSTYS